MLRIPVKVLPVVIGAVLLGACSGGHMGPPLASAPSASAAAQSATQQAQAAAKASNLPQPNFSTPDSAYVPLTKGTQLMYLYAAFSGLPPDYASMAGAISQDYRQTSDEFKKHDLLAALKPQIDAGIANAREHPYIIITDNNPQIGHYDFTQKAFPVGDSLFQNGGYEMFYDLSDYKLEVTNGQLYQHFNVPDESLAKTIEGMVSQNANFSERVYAFVQATDDSNGPLLKAAITKVELLGPNGQVVLQQATPH